MHKTFLCLVACGLGVAALLGAASALPLVAAQGLETPEGPRGAQGIQRIIVELSAPPLAVVYGNLANAPALQREIALRVAQIRIALEQALFIAQVTAPEVGATVTGRSQMSVNSVSLAVSAEKVPLIRMLRGVKAVYADPAVERNRP
jgi:hypothetical protein